MTDEHNPMNEGSDATAVPPARTGERRADEHADDTTGNPDALPWGEDEERHQGPADLGVGQPDLAPDDAVSGRTPRFSPGATDDSPGTPSILRDSGSTG